VGTGFTLTVRKTTAELSELLVLEPVSFVTKNGRLRGSDMFNVKTMLI